MGYYSSKLFYTREYKLQPFIAPDDFDPAAQPVNIYEKFNAIKATDSTASHIFSCSPNIQCILPSVPNVSYIYAETINGVEIVSAKIASGTVFTAGSTKRWVCSYYTGTTDISIPKPNGSVWMYVYNKYYSSFSDYLANTYFKYIHFDNLAQLKTIGSNAFYGCTGLTGSLTIPDSVTSIESQAFVNCTGLTGSLTIPDSVTFIGSSAFYGCTGLSGSLTIPDSVTFIGNYAFQGCEFTHVYCLKPTAPTAYINSFNSTPAELHVPATNSGYTVVPWNTLTVFSSIIADL